MLNGFQVKTIIIICYFFLSGIHNHKDRQRNENQTTQTHFNLESIFILLFYTLLALWVYVILFYSLSSKWRVFWETITIYCMNSTFYKLGFFVNSPRMFTNKIKCLHFKKTLMLSWLGDHTKNLHQTS